MLRDSRSTDATIPASDTEVGTDALAALVASSFHNTSHFEGEFSGTQRGSRGFGPARRGPFVSAKGPQTIGARAWRHVMARVRRQRPNTTTNYNDGIPSFDRPFAKLRAYSGQALRSE